ncbi:MAG: DNA topoisomerase I [Candidatus Pacearchaeota archaeon]
MPKKTSQKQIEQNEFRIFNPEEVKQTIEIPVKPKPSIEELETVEVIHGKDKKGNAKLVVPKKPKKEKAVKTKSGQYTLIITEKPQAAAKIAAALSNGKDKKINKPGGVSYYELNRNNKQIIVACAVGHLFSLSQAKKGADYPVFDIEWKPNYEVRKKDFTKKYFIVIQSLVKNADEIVVATDFDVEGEVIGYNIVRFIANRNDAKRMKYSSLTPKELQDSYDNVHPTIEWGQAIAGETRHFLDWIYGINLSRALMSAIKSTGKFKIMSIGRVQGPALHLIVNKEKQIQAFKPEPYWQVFITISDGKNKLELKYIKDLTKKQDLDNFNELKGKTAKAKTTKTKQIIPPPAPFDLTSLQTEAYKFHSITPSQTLQIAQGLYLAGLISYPRTSSQKIPEAMNPQQILEQLSKSHSSLTKHATRSKPIEGNKSDPAHPAIIPTGVHQKLTDRDEKIYNLIVKRFISCFCDNAELENKKVEVEINNLRFNEKGMEVVEPGWMNVYPAKMVEKEIKDFNGKVIIENIRSEEKETQPPRRFTPASIVTELEKRNLGTKATRANIIETLYDRNYIKEKSIQATDLGIRLIDTLDKYSPVIIDEKLTRELEKDMDIIRQSKKDLNKKQKTTIDTAEKALIKISDDFKKKEKEIGKELNDATEAGWEQQKEDNKLNIKCPTCKTGELTIKYTPRFKSFFVACTNYPECKQTFSLPSQSLIKKTDKLCEACNYPMLMRIKQGKRPWIFCFNKACPSRKELDINGNTKQPEQRYSGKPVETKTKKKIEKIK